MNGFDRIAPYYDFLAGLIFRKSIIKAQEYFLPEIKDGDRILILGGGTGWILNSIFKLTNPGEIWYVDTSQKMIEKSKARNLDHSKVHFIHGRVEVIPDHLKFDVVITNFFLDVFSTSEFPTLVRSIMAKLKPQGAWLCTDFVATNRWYQKGMLKVMYLFFGIVANLENRNLPDWETLLIKEGLEPRREKYFWSGFIKAAIFKNALDNSSRRF